MDTQVLHFFFPERGKIIIRNEFWEDAPHKSNRMGGGGVVCLILTVSKESVAKLAKS
jgi:hypothetical protein